MGTGSSKEEFGPSSIRSSRLSLGSSKKRDELVDLSDAINDARSEIGRFDGVRGDTRYEEYQKTLAGASQRLASIRLSGKKSNKSRCDRLEMDIKNLFLNLEEKVNANENNLDMAAVESTSFINQNPHTSSMGKGRGDFKSPQKKNDQLKISTLQGFEESVTGLDDEIHHAIQKKDMKELNALEKKIQMTLTDLELVYVEKYTPLSERKDEIGEYLIKLNNTLKKAKRGLNRTSGNYDRDSQLGPPQTDPKKRQLEELQKRFGEDVQNQKIKEKMKKENWQRNPLIDKLNAIDDNMLKLAEEMQKAIDLEDKKQFLILEKKIQILFTDLEMIQVEKYIPLQERKEDVSKTLIKMNKKLHRAKQNINRSSGSHFNDNSSLRSKTQEPPATSLEDMMKLTDDLDILELKVTSLQGTKTDEEYKTIKQNLNKLYQKLQEMYAYEDTTKKLKARTQERIKSAIQMLNERAKQNEITIESQMQELNAIKMEVKKFKNFALEFRGSTKDERYEFIDQNLRKSWANLTKVKESSEEVSSFKKFIIEEIQETLKFLSDKLQAPEPMYAEIIHANKTPKKPDIVGQIKQLENVIGRSSIYISNPDLSNIDKEELTSTLQRLHKEIDKQLMVLSTPNNNKDDEEVFVMPSTNGGVEQLKYNGSKQFKEISKHVEVEEPKYAETSFDNPLDLINSYNQDLQSQNVKSLESIMAVDAKVQELKKRIENFKGTKKDKEYSDIEDALMDSVIHLNGLDTKNQQNLKSSKDEVLHQIRQLQGELPKKLAANEVLRVERQDSNDLVEIRSVLEQTQGIRKRIDCFSGTYKNVQYVQIEDSLKNCLGKLNSINVENNPKLRLAKEKGKEKIEQYLKILDEKSIKVEVGDKNSAQARSPVQKNTEYADRLSFNVGPNTAYHKLEQLRDSLMKLKVAMEEFNGQYKDVEYEKIMESLKKCNEDIEKIDDKGSTSIKTSVQQYRSYIIDLSKYFEEKLNFGEN